MSIVIIAIVCFALYTHCSSREVLKASEGSRFTVYGSMRCGYTVKMINYLEAHKMSYTFVDVNKPDGNNAFNKATSGKNIRGVPYSIDHKTGEEIAGFREIIL